ncbi:cytochrome P450 [Bradyrhizobium algeriense]|uniref:cytochrome P450 n=1 Tax=Bradyrhizobium algeriense TaxID=634784 RepID=UPI000D39FE03|nr:cytochrome P450 [Bradyrhizobium algeriense]
MAAPVARRSDQNFRVYRPPAPAPRAKRLGPIRLISALKRNPLECWTSEHFEKLVVAGGLPVGHVVIINHPAAIRRVLLENDINYRKDMLQRRVLSAGMGEGLLSAEGHQWRSQRRTVAPLFARRTVTQCAPAMMDAANALVERWRQHGDATTLDVAAEMARLTLDVLERTIFSEGFGCNAEEARRAMVTYFNTVGRIDPLDLLGMPDWIPRINHLRVRSTLRFFERSIEHLIAARRQRLAERANSGPNDFLALLLAALDPYTGEPMSEAEVKSNIFTFIMAGHETTSNLLSWSLFLLSQSDDWRRRVQAEAEREINGSVMDLAEHLPETRAVIEEAARLYPPIAAISRVAIDADELAGEVIPGGTLVVISPYVLHRHRLLWPDPDLFEPRRFLGENRALIDRYSYLPFGAGPRTCIGSTFALQEATIVLATITRNFSLHLAPGHKVWPLLQVTLKPAGGLPMIIRCNR